MKDRDLFEDQPKAVPLLCEQSVQRLDSRSYARGQEVHR